MICTMRQIRCAAITWHCLAKSVLRTSNWELAFLAKRYNFVLQRDWFLQIGTATVWVCNKEKGKIIKFNLLNIVTSIIIEVRISIAIVNITWWLVSFSPTWLVDQACSITDIEHFLFVNIANLYIYIYIYIYNKNDITNRNISFVSFIFWLFSTSFNLRWSPRKRVFVKSWYAMILATKKMHILLVKKKDFLVSKCLQLTFIYLLSEYQANELFNWEVYIKHERMHFKLAVTDWFVYLSFKFCPSDFNSMPFSLMLNLFRVSVCRCFICLSLYFYYHFNIV